ncbi:MAG TPA: hypothetical protein VJ506_02185 [Candidatus Limnocylindrales bacterium]|nr:hypothetical protein [Candidatus Limnocylindrales bacterium]
MSPLGLRLLNRCGWKTDFSLWGCDEERGHAGPHHVPSDGRLPTNLTREQQEAWEHEMRDLRHPLHHKPRT